MTVQGSNVFPIGIKKRSDFAQAAVQQPSAECDPSAGWPGRPIGHLLVKLYAGPTTIDCSLSEEQIPEAIRALEDILGDLRAQQGSTPYKLVST